MAKLVVVYSRPECVQCEYTKKWLERKGVPYTEIDIEATPVAAEQLREQGITQLPYVKAGDQTWSGFKLDMIRGLDSKDYS